MISLFQFHVLWSASMLSDMPFAGSPVPTLLLLIFYLMMVKIIGPVFMEYQKPYNPRRWIIAYNIFQILANSYMFYYVSDLARCGVVFCPNFVWNVCVGLLINRPLQKYYSRNIASPVWKSIVRRQCWCITSSWTNCPIWRRHFSFWWKKAIGRYHFYIYIIMLWSYRQCG